MGRNLWLLGLLATALPQSLAQPTTTSSSSSDDFAPSELLARRRAPQIFNAVHHAMRQWGSSLHHNGMSFFVATVPAGVQFYHGNASPESPTDPDWLAYEIEHAEGFARGRGPGRGPPGKGKGPPGGHEKREDAGEQQHMMGDVEEDEEESHGYLHVYRTTRPMQYLYVDGMGGGKTDMGTLDSQDYLLRGQKSESQAKDAEREREHLQRESEGTERNQELRRAKRAPGGPMDEQQRAIDLCKLAKEWNLSGIVRMEAGFEIIHCDFSDGLQQIQALQRPDSGGRGHGMGIEFVRGLSERYQGIGASRTIIDYSSMVSTFFFPMNLTNPDPKRQDLPRLSSTTDEELLAVKNYLAGVVAERRGEDVRTIDWQDMSDLIVGRYSDRLQYMVEAVDTVEAMASELDFLLTVFVDAAAPSDKAAAIDRCTGFYMQVRPRTEADRLIQAAFLAVSRDICATLFQARDLVVANPAPDAKALSAAGSALGALADRLAWTRFKRCPACALDEVCVIPMWPIGTVDEYYHPRCSNGTQDDHGDRYWGGFGGGPGGGPGKGRGRGPPPPPM